MLIVDVSASGNLAALAQSKRELAAELPAFSLPAPSRNNDKVGCFSSAIASNFSSHRERALSYVANHPRDPLL